MSALPITFKDDVELLENAEKFIINDRIASLGNDVKRCLPDDKKEGAAYAPSPALMYCLSIIDLMGSLYAGDARSGNTMDNSARFLFISFFHSILSHQHNKNHNCRFDGQNSRIYQYVDLVESTVL